MSEREEKKHKFLYLEQVDPFNQHSLKIHV